MDLGSLLIMIGLTLLVVAFLARPLVDRSARAVTAALKKVQATNMKLIAFITPLFSRLAE